MNPSGELRLRPLRHEDEAVVRQAQVTMARDDFEFALGLDAALSWAAYLDRLDRSRRGIDIPAGRVPATFVVADVDGEIVGRASIRHQLDEWLAERGGHIGYGVLAQHRRRGYAVEILRQSLIVARAVGVERALLVCDDDNAGSIATIEHCGGRLEDVRSFPGADVATRRYWID